MQTTTVKRHVDIVYVEAAGDIVSAFSAWRSGMRYQKETSLTFSGQFFDFCRQRGLSAYALAFGHAKKIVSEKCFTVETRPGFSFGTGVLYHCSRIANALTVLISLIRYRPRYLVVASGVTAWIFLFAAKYLGITTIACLHNTFWPRGREPRTVGRRAIALLDRLAFRYIIDAVVCVSAECERQLKQVVRGSSIKCFRFLPQFDPAIFQSITTEPRHSTRPFTIVYVGRIEEVKGVLDLVGIATSLLNRGIRDFRFVVCGEGTSLNALRRQAADAGTGSNLQVMGRLNTAQLVETYKTAHIVIVPTRDTFPEGFAMVAAESVLLGRPVLCSDIVPAAEVLAGAVVVAKANDIEHYVSHITMLMNDADLYRSLCDGTRRLRGQFFDRSLGLEAALGKAMSATRG